MRITLLKIYLMYQPQLQNIRRRRTYVSTCEILHAVFYVFLFTVIESASILKERKFSKGSRRYHHGDENPLTSG